VAAAQELEKLGENGALHDLRDFTATLQAGDLKRSVDRTIEALEVRQKSGQRVQMRRLPQCDAILGPFD
jgi:hypothetical protein